MSDEETSVSTLPEATVAALDARLDAEQAERRLPSIVAGLVRGGALVWSGGAGEVASGAGRGGVAGQRPGTDVQYRMGSITKTLVAVCVLRLADQGLVSLDDPVTDHLDAPTGRATVAQLLAHASGLRAETAGPWWERITGGDYADLLDRLEADPTPHPAGRRFHYSNVGFGVLGELLARVRGAEWGEVVRTELLEPLGMDRTTPRPQAPSAPGLAVHPFADVLLPEPEHHHGAMAPAGQLWSTIRDLARWAAFVAGPDHGGMAGLLDPATHALLARPVVVDDRPGQPWTTAHSLGFQVWNRGGQRLIGHGGSMPGFLAGLQVDVDTGDGVVLATNTTAGLGPDLAADLLSTLQEQVPHPPDPWRPATTAIPVELAGVWYWGPSPLAIRVAADGELDLAAVPPALGRASRFRPAGDGTYVGLDGYYADEILRVVRADDGTPRWLEVASFVLTRTPYDPAADIPGGVDPAGWRPRP